MGRLIDADELEKKLASYFTGDRGGEATMRELITDETIADSIRIIREQPTVDAQAEIDRLNRLGLTWYDTILKLMEMVNGTDQWIPCSERLPKQGQEVICQCRARIIKVLKLDANGDWYQDADHCYMSGFVIAWMPLPKPYERKEE